MLSLYTTHDIAQLLGADASTVAKWIDAGHLMAFRTPGKHRRVRAEDLRAFLVAHQMPMPRELSSAFRLLVVDDDDATLRAISRAAKELGPALELTTTRSPIEALLMLGDLRPDGLALDLNMDEMSGIEVCRKVSKRPEHQDLKVVTFTGGHGHKAEQESIAAGALACLPKPLDVKRLMELMKVTSAAAAKKSA